LSDQNRILDQSDDEDDFEEAERTKIILERLLTLLPTVFPENEHEPHIIFHDDLSKQNALVHDSGDITAVVDWECVSALPLWRAYQMPKMQHGRIRADMTYRLDAGCQAEPGIADVDKRGLSDLYWEPLLEYERGQLRPLFQSEMELLRPGWMEVYKPAGLKRDFELAVQNADTSWVGRAIRCWIETYGTSKAFSLAESFGTKSHLHVDQ
jgi:hypothetical protein